MFYIFRINKKRVYFVAYHGRLFACNPKYLYQYILSKYGTAVSYVWEFIDTDKAYLVPDAKIVKRDSVKALYYQLTSKYIITNTEFRWFIPLRKKQVLLQTWHGGGAYKKVGLSLNYDRIELLEQKLNARNISYYITSSKKFTEVQSVAKNVPESKFIPTGMPRNAFLMTEHKELKKTVCDYFAINQDVKLILFAPTYRGAPKYKKAGDCYLYTDFDYETLLSTFENRFGWKCKLLYRGHYYDKNLKKNDNPFVLDATQYEDMQELLYVSDALITDFSSSMWDFALTKKPGFIYLPDYESLSFYTDFSLWPFPVSTKFEDLIDLINKFDENENIKKIENHLNRFGSYESSNACELVLKSIHFLEKSRLSV